MQPKYQRSTEECSTKEFHFNIILELNIQNLEYLKSVYWRTVRE